MGFGDEIIGTGLARGARARGKRIAFGDGRQIKWGPWCQEIFYNNPNIAWPGTENGKDIEWIDHYKGARKYNTLLNGKWQWNYDFKVQAGEFYFDDIEKNLMARQQPGFIVIEPNVPWHKVVAANKDWGDGKYDQVAQALKKHGHRVLQFKHKNSRRIIDGIEIVENPKFRHVIAMLSRAKLYIGPEGGMHHAAAAVNVRAVVIFGGFIPPAVMGYDNQISLTGNAQQACGNIQRCEHCRKAMQSIAVEEVVEKALVLL